MLQRMTGRQIAIGFVVALVALWVLAIVFFYAAGA
jgi:hypothetical protein